MKLELHPIGYVEAARTDMTDDFWGGEAACITLADRVEPEVLEGIESFSHVEVVFFFDRVEPQHVTFGTRHPRNNPAWPLVGIFAQRGKNRPNRIGTTICRILRREGRCLFVTGLDAINGTPVLDIKPVMMEFLLRTEVRQPPWSRELMRHYWETAE